MGKRLFVDMDGTLARFHDQVNYLERMWEPGFFRNLEPFDNMLYAVKDFINNNPDVEVFILSSKILGEPPYCEAEKNDWLDKYLPEVDADHRIFPNVGVSKAQCVWGGLKKDDYLLDDYNKSLREWEAAGGHAVKCHNNINQHGLGAYGGGRGELWMGDMVHTTDRPEMISAELSQHMGLDFNLQTVAAAYGMKLASYTVEPKDAPCEWYQDVASGSWHAEHKADHWHSERVYTNPLNAIRSCTGRHEFDELPVDFLKENTRMTKGQLADFAANNYVTGAPEYDAPSFLWEGFAEETRGAVAANAEAESVESLEDFETLRQQAEHDAAVDDEMEPD